MTDSSHSNLASLSSLSLTPELHASLESILSNTDLDPIHRWRDCLGPLRAENAKPSAYRAVWELCFSNELGIENHLVPGWYPHEEDIRASNLERWRASMAPAEADLIAWAQKNRAKFWEQAVAELGIQFSSEATTILEVNDDETIATWFPGSKLNIVNSCFQADPESPAIVAQKPGEPLRQVSYRQLRERCNQISNSIVRAGFQRGDALAVVMPMTAESVAIYLGVIQAGCSIVSIADSFAAPEITTRLRIANAKAVFTYDKQVRGTREFPLYERVTEATDACVICIPESDSLTVALRQQDLAWDDFLTDAFDFDPVIVDAQQTVNILFSSGTTGDPKAIPWSHLTPMKCAVDGFCHQNIKPGDVCVWPTNLGWMMGPWLIFASLINRGTIGLYEDVPMGSGFGAFVEKAKVNVLGVVPTIVKAWRKSGEMEAFDWSEVNVFSSTGESSQHDDMFYLSALAGMKPVIEYCGGTEIGGGYITSTVTLPNVAGAFNSPAIGLDFVLLDEHDQPADEGEVFLVGPSIGLSSDLLNRDHGKTYFANTPTVEGLGPLRRHGDHFKRINQANESGPNGVFYVAGGRVDDTMNLGGIKISSAEIERVLNGASGVKETAAVAVALESGPSQLVVFAVAERDDTDDLKQEMNQRIRSQLNPLFKVSRVISCDSLPRTASGKVMRRKLRERI